MFQKREIFLWQLCAIACGYHDQRYIAFFQKTHKRVRLPQRKSRIMRSISKRENKSWIFYIVSVLLILRHMRCFIHSWMKSNMLPQFARCIAFYLNLANQVSAVTFVIRETP